MAALACGAQSNQPGAQSSEQLEHIVSGADEVPLSSHLLFASEQKLPEPPGLFDLAEYWLGQFLPQTVATSSLSRP